MRRFAVIALSLGTLDLKAAPVSFVCGRPFTPAGAEHIQIHGTLHVGSSRPYLQSFQVTGDLTVLLGAIPRQKISMTGAFDDKNHFAYLETHDSKMNVRNIYMNFTDRFGETTSFLERSNGDIERIACRQKKI